LAASLLPALAPSQASAAKPPQGFQPIKDSQDGYSFLSPFGWQEVSVKGQDIVYKDVIEPLESVSVSITPTDKKDITEYGSPVEVAATLSKNVLTPSNQEVKVLNVSERETEGRKYVEFEFASKAPNYIRHALASVTIANGKFYTLTTGANEFRWDKMKDRLKLVVASFDVVDRFPAS
jgi:photosystem II oxygen-evolving enhancer protein 2